MAGGHPTLNVKVLVVYTRGRKDERVAVGSAVQDSTGTLYISLVALPVDGQLMITLEQQKEAAHGQGD